MLTLIRPRAAAVATAAVPSHPADVIGLDDLVSLGKADLAHRWTHHLVLPDEAAAVAAAKRLEIFGWHIEALAAMPAPFPGWTLRVFRDTVVDAAALDEARDQFEYVAAEGRGSYGGWDANPAPRHALAMPMAA